MKSCIVFSVDSNYLEYFLVSVNGIFNFSDFNKIPPIYIIIDNTIGEKEKLIVRSYFKEKQYDKYYFVNDDIIPNVKLKRSERDHVSKSTYYRLFIELFIPYSFDTVVYLDTDILIVSSIEHLFFLVPKNPIAAVSHHSEDESFRLHSTFDVGYFQAGILVINYSSWLKSKVIERSCYILENQSDRIMWWDQDVLNIIFAKSWDILEDKFNFHNRSKDKLSSRSAAIIHFDGTNKPWKKYSHRFGKKLWLNEYRSIFLVNHPSDNLVYIIVGYLVALIRKVL
jgi:lipopolysaccharide biosynthesis glycosyltransferase